MNLTLAEQETHLNMVADDRSVWHVYSEDPVMIKRLDKIAIATRETATGKHYELDKTQVQLRKKRELTESQRLELLERLQGHQSAQHTGVLNAQNGR